MQKQEEEDIKRGRELRESHQTDQDGTGRAGNTERDRNVPDNTGRRKAGRD
jgi:hypothetical protein